MIDENSISINEEDLKFDKLLEGLDDHRLFSNEHRTARVNNYINYSILLLRFYSKIVFC